MTIRRLTIEHVGPIEKADVTFGDLTVLVGPQATGKSIFLQMLKLLVDARSILDILETYGIAWDRNLGDFLDVYLGEGMRGIWREGSRVRLNGRVVDLEKLVAPKRARGERAAFFFIPAQRVLTLSRGWPRPFSDYSPADPFVVRDFSETIRQLLQRGLVKEIFPSPGLEDEASRLLRENVFAEFGLQIDDQALQRRLVLSGGGHQLPFMVWSAGQREFVPLLLGFHFLQLSLLHHGVSCVIIEEIEMGLHPRAISAVLLLVLELLSNGYRIFLSTHSTHVLDVVWALRVFQERGASPDRLLELFDVAKTPKTRAMAAKVLTKKAKVYFFERGQTKDISKLDPGSDDAAESGWGGLSGFSGRVADIVARVVNETGG